MPVILFVGGLAPSTSSARLGPFCASVGSVRSAA
jgi:hypothetical protein